MRRAYRYRFHPARGQARPLARASGCARHVTGRCLTLRQRRKDRAWRQEGSPVVALFLQAVPCLRRGIRAAATLPPPGPGTAGLAGIDARRAPQGGT